MKPKLKIKISGNDVTVGLAGKGEKYSRVSWRDDRNLSEKLLKKIDELLRKNKMRLTDISKVDFSCDSPYYIEKRAKAIVLEENVSSKGKCGFTAWQVGEITAKILNFAIKNNPRSIKQFASFLAEKGQYDKIKSGKNH